MYNKKSIFYYLQKTAEKEINKMSKQNKKKRSNEDV